MNQFQDNLGILSIKDYNQIKKSHILLVGLGGLGGYIAHGLVRLGVESLILVDFDIFQLSNLNRQLFSNHLNLNLNKTAVIKQALLEINPNVKITIYTQKIETIDIEVFRDIDIIIDGVDDIFVKCYLEKLGVALNKPLLHGAIGGWYGQLGFIMPGSNLLSELYGKNHHGIEKTLKSPTFTPAIVANMMIGEFVKFVIGDSHTLINQIMMIDLLNHDYQIVFDKKNLKG
ncbi:MAG: ThiF family adenylyltransferase [Firmicutes bacterium]|nr:ThiF family adenylyltransferase [Bacillota bacterium]